jgi:hypothetical protein
VGKTESWADQQIKERNRRVLRKYWWRFGLMALALAGVGVSIWLIAPDVEVPLWAVIPAMFVLALGVGWPQIAGTYHLATGRDAEKWTSKELRKVCGPDWHVIDGIPFHRRDVDHVLVGPGGVYAVETKSTDSVVDLASSKGRKTAKSWIHQAQRSAQLVSAVLKGEGVEVYAVVVAWGSEVSGSPYVYEGVPVLGRKDLDQPDVPWRRSIRVLTDAQVNAIVGELIAHRDKRFAYERSQKRRRVA